MVRDASTLPQPDYDERQDVLAAQLGRRGMSDLEHGTIVVLPSITFPPEELRKIIGIQYYEERMLCMLLLLSRPRLELVYITSHSIAPSIIDYYLSFLPDPENARSRLHLVAVGDTTPRPLSEKLLENPPALDRIRSVLSDEDATYLFPFNVTELERELTSRLGGFLYGPRPQHVPLGSKSGARRIARVAGVPVLEGREDIYSLEEMEQAVHELREARPDARFLVMKLNNGFSGQGNAIVDLELMRSPFDTSPVAFCSREESWSSYAAKLQRDGGIVEELLRVPGLVSPSVQMRIFADGSYEVVSTHDQILGGPDEQVYLGCRFPAREDYRTEIQAYGLGIARELAAHGVVGSFGIDFIIAPGRRPYMAEINLRLGGTTHPFLVARFATGGAYDPASGDLLVGEEPRFYVATDNIKSRDYVGLTPLVVIDAVRAEGLAFDSGRQEGIILHLLGALEEHGKLGATCIAPDMQGSERLHARLVETVDRLTA